MEMKLPENVRRILHTLTEHGFEAYAVGGCVRDSILQRRPTDWDITTSAKPEEVKSLFLRTVDTGIRHGTVTVLFGKDGYEITTYRVDGTYRDGRHPDSVTYTASLEEDLKRRDFTINAMAYHDQKGLIDLFGGLRDLEQGVIRCVGSPEERFGEDALRMLRAIRFSAQLGFCMEQKTRSAVKKLAPTIAKVSKERIRTELEKILLSDRPQDVELAAALGITAVILPEYDACKDRKTVLRLLETMKDRGIRKAFFFYAAMFYQTGSETTARILRDLKLDNDTVFCAETLVGAYETLTPGHDAAAVRRQASVYGKKFYAETLTFLQLLADVQNREQEKKEWEYAQTLFDEAVKRGDCMSLKELSVKGADLIRLGMKPGKELGDVLNGLLDQVLEHPERNQKEILLSEEIINVRTSS